MLKKYRWLKTALITVLFAGAIAAPASAMSYSDAWNTAWNTNIYQCNNAGYGLYSCRHSNFQPPSCIGTGVNQSGKTQWICGSQFVQNPNSRGITPRLCDETLKLGPYGGVIGINNVCQGIGGTG